MFASTDASDSPNIITSYQSVQGYGEDSLTIKKSRFIAQVWPVQTEAVALKLLEEVQKKHCGANHHCYAYQIGLTDIIQKASDNGEPAGTAGKPILEVLKHQELKNVIGIVTRYFGGTLLGTGGLVRAYGQAASMSITAAKVVTRRLMQNLQIELDYTWLGKVENETHAAGYSIQQAEYGQKVKLQVRVPITAVKQYLTLITNATNGQAEFVSGAQAYL